jgi:PilZ domain-containing protein
MPDVMADRRNAARYTLIVAAEVSELDGSNSLHGRTSDVSRSGCYIDTLNPMPVASLIRVRLRHGDNVFEAAGRVMYVCPGLGMGVMFDKDTSPEQLTILERWLATTTMSPR